nr:hypothetical protein [Tanacetum cinerariifolium]
HEDEYRFIFGFGNSPRIPTTSPSLPPVIERETDATKDMVHPTNNESTEDVQPLVVLTESLILNSEPVISPIIEPVASLDLNFNISFANALILMPKFGPSIKSLLTNKDKLCELAKTLLNEHCSVILLKKLPKKLRDPGEFLISCNFLEMAECLALVDLGLANRLISCPVGVAKYVFVKVGTFHFSADFVVIDFDADPRVPLILGRSFLKVGRALIDVFEANYNDMTANRIDVINMACEEYSQEVLGFFDVIVSGNPTPYYDPIVSTTSPTLTTFGNIDFLLKEVDAFLALEDDLTSPKVDQSYVDTEGGILLLEAFLNDDPSLPPPNQGNYLPQVRKELKICEAKSDKSSIDEPLEEKTALITFLKSHKRAIAWKLSDIKGIDPEFCTHKMLMVEDHEPAVQHQRRVNPKIHDVIKNEVLKLLDAGLIYPISDSPWKDSKVRLLRWVLLLQEFTFKVIGTKGAENLTADHLSRLESPHRNVLDPKEINELFPLETLNLVSSHGNSSTPWFADFANYHAGNFVVKGMSS